MYIGLFSFNKGLRYAEGVIEVGESVTVFGRGGWGKMMVSAPVGWSSTNPGMANCG